MPLVKRAQDQKGTAGNQLTEEKVLVSTIKLYCPFRNDPKWVIMKSTVPNLNLACQVMGKHSRHKPDMRSSLGKVDIVKLFASYFFQPISHISG